MTTAVIPLTGTGQSFWVPAFEVTRTGGARWPDHVLRDVVEVTFEDSVDGIDSFTIVLDNWDTETLHPRFVGQEAAEDLWDLVQPGNAVELRMGYRGEQTDLRVMTRGYLTALDVEMPENGATRVTVRGLSQLDKLRDRQYTWSWPATPDGTTTDSAVAEAIGTPGADPDAPRLAGGLRVLVDARAKAAEPPQTHVFMNSTYPIVFLMQLARRNGYDVYLTDLPDKTQALYFGPSQHVRDHTYVLEWGKTLTSLRTTVSSARQVKKVTVLGWDRVKKVAVKGEASIDKEGADLPATTRAIARANGREEVVTDLPVSTDQQAADKANKILHEVAARAVQVEGVVVGLPDLRAGRRVRLERLGPHLTGNYFVTSTRTVLNDSGLRTTFKARLEGEQSFASAARQVAS